MYLLSLFSAGLLALSPVLCDFCSPVVFLNEARAQCFLESFDERLTKLTRAKRNFVEVDLDACTAEPIPGDKSVVPAIGDPGFANGAKIYLDENGMNCLRREILADKETFEPSRVLDLVDLCESRPGQ